VLNATPRPIYPPENTRYPLYRRLGGPRAGLNGCGKSPPLGFDLRTVQPVASRYTDCAIPAPTFYKILLQKFCTIVFFSFTCYVFNFIILRVITVRYLKSSTKFEFFFCISYFLLLFKIWHIPIFLISSFTSHFLFFCLCGI
jgi:hypothetical protein